jgi:hypothetical protein
VSSDEAGRGPERPTGPAGLLPREALLLLVVLLGAAWWAYRPALDGPPIADDYGYLLNPWVMAGTAWEFFDPTSQATHSLNNYAPLRALTHAAEWRLFGQNARPYHLVNLGLHVVASLLLVALLASRGIAFPAAAVGGTLFLLHPANVEAVAWMNQVWSPLALALALGAVLARRQALLGTLLFALALMAKPQALFALPLAAMLAWCDHVPGASWRREAGWLLAWTAVFVLHSVAELAIFLATGSGSQIASGEGAGVLLRSLVALGARYLVLAATSFGAAAFQEPSAARSLLDPWWLGGLAALLGLGAWLVAALRRRSDEAAFLVGAAAAYAPVSQIFPFLYPMADRYLYFVLPGLLGAALAALCRALSTLPAPWRRTAPRLLAALAAALVLGFTLHSRARAGIWRAEELVLADAARRWPEGVPAEILRSRRAGERGDVAGSVAALERARAKGWDYWTGLLSHPSYAPVRDDARFQELIHALAGDTVEQARQLRRPTQADLNSLAQAHAVRGETAEAIAALERALALSGPLDEPLRRELTRLRATNGAPVFQAPRPGDTIDR